MFMIETLSAPGSAPIHRPLTKNRGAPAAERHSHGDLRRARDAARHQQAGRVHAADEQNGSDRAPQNQNRLAYCGRHRAAVE